MQTFDYKKAKSQEDALASFAARSGTARGARYLSGGTTLIDLMKLEVETPGAVVDLNALGWNKIEKTKEGGARIGASVRNSDLGHDPLIQKQYPVLPQALLSGASAQLRNKATTAGNLLQRTRCVYFRDPSKACNKRSPGSGCAAIQGFNRNLAILGTSASCIASNPSDMNVAMMALGATVHATSSKGARDIAIDDFYLLPGKTPEKETVLENGELITGVTLAPLPAGARSLYLKLRDRASYEFALASAAVIVSLHGGRMQRVRMAMGGVGARPWRSLAAEKILEGEAPSEAKFKAAAAEFVRGAVPQSENAFKIDLAQRCLVRALKDVTSGKGA